MRFGGPVSLAATCSPPLKPSLFIEPRSWPSSFKRRGKQREQSRSEIAHTRFALGRQVGKCLRINGYTDTIYGRVEPQEVVAGWRGARRGLRAASLPWEEEWLG